MTTSRCPCQRCTRHRQRVRVRKILNAQLNFEPQTIVLSPEAAAAYRRILKGEPK